VLAVATGGASYEELREAEPDLLMHDLQGGELFWRFVWEQKL
jgi:hypothetical protein